MYITWLGDVRALPANTEQAELAQVLSALYPAGSITGAPKRQAMRIIAQLEQHPRASYCHWYRLARGWAVSGFECGYPYGHDLARNASHSWGWQALIADSEAEAEWVELHAKAAPMFSCLAS